MYAMKTNQEGGFMKRTIIGFLLMAILWLPYQVLAETKTVTLATGDWEPYTSKDMENFGTFTEIVSAVFKEVGIEPNYKFVPWKRAEQQTEAGNFFAAFPYIITEERKQGFDFSDRVMFSTGRFFYNKKYSPQGISYNKFEDLAPYTISGVRGYWYEKPFKEAKLNVDYVNADTQSFQKLFVNRVQLAASDELVGWALIKSLYPQEVAQFAIVEKPMNQDDLRLMVSRKYPNAQELTKKFNAAMESIRKKGIVSQILAKHGVKE